MTRSMSLPFWNGRISSSPSSADPLVTAMRGKNRGRWEAAIGSRTWMTRSLIELIVIMLYLLCILYVLSKLLLVELGVDPQHETASAAKKSKL